MAQRAAGQKLSEHQALLQEAKSMVVTISSHSIKEPVPRHSGVIPAACTAAGEGVALQQAVLPLVQGLQQVRVGDGQLLARRYLPHGAHHDGTIWLEEVRSIWAAAVVDPAC